MLRIETFNTMFLLLLYSELIMAIDTSVYGFYQLEIVHALPRLTCFSYVISSDKNKDFVCLFEFIC